MITIVYSGRYWTGTGFSKQEARGMKFKTSRDAWKYVDYVFPVDIAEECSLKERKA